MAETTAAEIVKRPNLFDVGVEGAEITRLLEESEGELTPELEARFDALLSAGADRLVAGAMVVRMLEESANACGREIQRLSDRAASYNRDAERLKARMLFAVDHAFSGKLKTATVTIWGQNSGATKTLSLAEGTTLEQIGEADPEAVRVKRELNASGLKERLKLGLALPVGVLVEEHEGTRYLRIK